MSFFRSKPKPVAYQESDVPSWDSLAYGHELANNALSIFEEAAETLRDAIGHHNDVVEDSDLVIAKATERKQEAVSAIGKNQAVLSNIEAITAPVTAAEPATAA